MAATNSVDHYTQVDADGSAIRMRQLPKVPTGISGLDEVTGGGLPHGRPAMWP